ncbi:MAG: enoyl-CoA hydratase-related protein [Acidimicrobiia bacterium]
MQYETLIVERRRGVAHLTLNRPDAANGINLRMAEELLHATTGLADDPTVRVVLLTGAGARFCGGGDVKGFANLGDGLGHHIREITVPLHAAVSQLVRLDAPVLASVQGSAAGAGLGLVAAADLVVAAESTKLVMAYTGIGLSPDCGTSWFLPRLVGVRRALELAITNRVLSAAEALEWGIVTTVVPDDELAATTDALVAQLAAGPTLAYGAAKRLVHGSLEHTLDQHLALETEAMARTGGSADGAEGVAAFVAKRPPEFRGT